MQKYWIVIFVCIDFSVCFCLLWLFACVCVCLFTNRCLCVSVSVWEHVIWVHWYTDTRTHMPCVGTLCLQSDGVWAGARTKLCTGGLSLQLKSAPWSKPSPLRAGQSPPNSPPRLSPLPNLDSWLDATTDTQPGTLEKEGERSYCEIDGILMVPLRRVLYEVIKTNAMGRLFIY